MAFLNSYHASFTGGSPYELARIDNQYSMEEEERKREEEEYARRQNSYADSVARMDTQRDMRLGRIPMTMEQKIADPYSDLYQSAPAPTPTMPQEIMFGDVGQEPIQHLFQPTVRSISPEGQRRVSLFREATRSGSAMTPSEVAEREQIKADEAIRVATERDKLLAGRQDQQQQQQTLRASAGIQAGAPGADRMAIAKDLETSASMTAAPAANAPAVAEAAQGGPPLIQTDPQKEIEDTFRVYRKRGWTDEQITRKLKQLGKM